MATDHPQRIRALADQLAAHPDVHQRLNQIADLVEERAATRKRDRLSDELVKVGKAASELAAEDGLTLEDRDGLRKATGSAQLRYLREISPRAAEAYERGRAA